MIYVYGKDIFLFEWFDLGEGYMWDCLCFVIYVFVIVKLIILIIVWVLYFYCLLIVVWNFV